MFRGGKVLSRLNATASTLEPMTTERVWEMITYVLRLQGSVQSQHNKDLALPIQLTSTKGFLIPSKLVDVLGNKDLFLSSVFHCLAFTTKPVQLGMRGPSSHAPVQCQPHSAFLKPQEKGKLHTGLHFSWVQLCTTPSALASTHPCLLYSRGAYSAPQSS